MQLPSPCWSSYVSFVPSPFSSQRPLTGVMKKEPWNLLKMRDYTLVSPTGKILILKDKSGREIKERSDPEQCSWEWGRWADAGLGTVWYRPAARQVQKQRVKTCRAVWLCRDTDTGFLYTNSEQYTCTGPRWIGKTRNDLFIIYHRQRNTDLVF